jgi:hypothetical protein
MRNAPSINPCGIEGRTILHPHRGHVFFMTLTLLAIWLGSQV